jgi:hypothetical protein
VALSILPSLCAPQPRLQIDPAELPGTTVATVTPPAEPVLSPAAAPEPMVLLGSFLGVGSRPEDRTGEIQKPAE